MNRIDTYVSGTQQSLRGDGTVDATLTLADVRTRLFDWSAVEAPVTVMTSFGLTTLDSHKAITRSDNGDVLSIVGAGYKVHQYDEWLTENVATLLDTDDLVIRSAGTLNNGRKAWVQVGTPEGIVGPGGIEYLPIVGAYTSLDASMSSTYKDNQIVVVCENTYAASLKDGKHRIAIKHTRNSTFDALTAREALGIVFANSESFNAELEALLAVSVSDMQWENLVRDLVNPSTDSKRSVTMASNKTDALMNLWRDDPRVSPWKGTGLGAMQALSTYRQWVQTVKGATRDDRNMDNVMTGISDKADVTDAARIFALA